MSRLSRQRLNSFLDMLAAERGAARNTLEAYERDVSDYLEFLGGRAPDAAQAEDNRGSRRGG
jgi:integrase/recombinase XerD